MTTTAFLILLTACAVITSLLTEAAKKFLDSIKVRYASNIVVLIIAIIVGWGATAVYYVNAQVPFNALNSVYLALMGIANWVGAMVGYDRVRQTIAQIGKQVSDMTAVAIMIAAILFVLFGAFMIGAFVVIAAGKYIGCDQNGR